MADRGAKYADKALSRIDRELQATYKTASRELARKLADFKKKFEVKDREKRIQRDNGEITEEEYKDWLGGQVFMRKQWEQKIEQVNQVMLHHNEQAVKIINESSFDVFAENYYAEAFKAQWICADISFNVYNTQAIARLIKENPKLLPEWKIDEEKDYTWNYKKVNNIVKQGIIQGEGIEQITERLCRELSTLNDKKMRMFARTAVTGAQSAGRQLQMDEAAKLDIEQEKEWLATLDGVTRDSHRKMDGVRVPYNKPFPNGLMYPGDPEGDPGEVYNCRCTTTTIYPKYENRQNNWREDETINGVPYEVWKEGKKAAKDWQKGQEQPEEKEAVKNEYKPDKYDAEYAALEKRLKEAKEEQRAKRAEEYNEMTALSKEIDEYQNLRRYHDQDISAYDKFATEKEYSEYRKALIDEIEKLHEKQQNMERFKAPDGASDDEYEKAFEDHINEKKRLRQEIEQKEAEYFGMREWRFIEKARKAQSMSVDDILGKIEKDRERWTELNSRQYKDSDEIKELTKKKSGYFIEETVKQAQEKGIEWLTPNKVNKPFDMDDVLSRLAGADKTEGSCASLAFAYIGQRGGYNVIDFRDGGSRELFSYNCKGILECLQKNGTSSTIGTAKSYTTAGKRALKGVQEGKEYYFECGRHAAVVRMVNGDLQYLELQSGYRKNTWYSFSQYGVDETLNWRFGARTKAYGDVNAYILDADEMSKDERFLKLLGYINTDPEKQAKGEGGGEK